MKIAEALLAREVLDAEQVRRLAAGQLLDESSAGRRRGAAPVERRRRITSAAKRAHAHRTLAEQADASRMTVSSQRSAVSRVQSCRLRTVDCRLICSPHAAPTSSRSQTITSSSLGNVLWSWASSTSPPTRSPRNHRPRFHDGHQSRHPDGGGRGCRRAPGRSRPTVPGRVRRRRPRRWSGRRTRLASAGWRLRHRRAAGAPDRCLRRPHAGRRSRWRPTSRPVRYGSRNSSSPASR